tara:strand:- start:145 stop:666 length:522 start_codon:yes stop_codon:yes gene_type:complete
MAYEKKKDERKFYKKKRFILPTGLILSVLAFGIYGAKMGDELIEKCNKGSIEACKEIESEWEYLYDNKKSRSKITNPYFTDKFKKLDKMEEYAEKKKAEEKARKEKESAEREQRIDKMNACKTVLKMSLKDPDSYKELNSLEDQFRFGIIEYSATNSFGGRIRQQFNCNLKTD